MSAKQPSSTLHESSTDNDVAATNNVAASVPATSINSDVNPFDELVGLLNAEQRAELEILNQRLESREANLERVNAVLGDALTQRRDDPIFASILSPLIERSIQESIAHDPKVLAESLMPSVQIGVRRTVNALFSDMVLNLNRTLEHSMNLKWRWESISTGRSFAEVVLSNTLIYSVEQVLLVDKESGLLLQQASTESNELEDGDMVSAMLTAINDFVRDSFRINEQASLNTISMGELTLLIEQGRYTYIAAVVRGIVPAELNETLQKIQHVIEIEKREVLENFSGDTEPLAPSQVLLYQALGRKDKEVSARPHPVLWVALVAIFALGGWWAIHHSRVVTKWNNLILSLDAQPTVHITYSRRQGKNVFIEGLADSVALESENIAIPDIIRAAGYTTKQIDIEDYIHPDYFEMRQQTMLQNNVQRTLYGNLYANLPEGVQFEQDAATLWVTGMHFPKHQAWFEQVRYQALALPDVEAVQVAQGDAKRILTELMGDISQQYFLFSIDSVVNYGTDSSINHHYMVVHQYLQALLKAAALLDYPLSLTLVSHVGMDDTLTGDALESLLVARAQRVSSTLHLPSLVIVFPFALHQQYQRTPLSLEDFYNRHAAAVPVVVSDDVQNIDEDAVFDTTQSDNRARLGHVHLEVTL